MARARLLRLGQPQREGDLPALHGLVRRQPELAVAAPADGQGDPLRRGHRRPAGGAWTRPQKLRRRRRPAVRRASCSSTPSSPIRTDTVAKDALADVYEQLGYGAENGTWRNFYLIGALELREGDQAAGHRRSRRGHGQRADRRAALRHHRHPDRRPTRRRGVPGHRMRTSPTSTQRLSRLTLSNGALIQTENPRTAATADLTLTLTKAQLLGLLGGRRARRDRPHRRPGVLGRLLGLLDTPDAGVRHRHAVMTLIRRVRIRR